MKAIITKYIPATNTKPARIKARAEGVPAVTLSTSEADTLCEKMMYRGNSEELRHKAVALELCRRMNWNTKLVGGGLPDQSGYAFCFWRGAYEIDL